MESAILVKMYLFYKNINNTMLTVLPFLAPSCILSYGQLHGWKTFWLYEYYPYIENTTLDLKIE